MERNAVVANSFSTLPDELARTALNMASLPDASRADMATTVESATLQIRNSNGPMADPHEPFPYLSLIVVALLGPDGVYHHTLQNTHGPIASECSV